MLRTSTPRAVIFSALTTTGSFGALALSNHPGTASMGFLLMIAIAFTMVCTLLVLPALLQLSTHAPAPPRETPTAPQEPAPHLEPAPRLEPTLPRMPSPPQET
jgi:uncharacterized membrane protein YdfJ with MMPL/SSD domain